MVKLVKELHDQCMRANVLFEILVFDDASKPVIKTYNEVINGMFGVNYIALSDNLGRSKIRNRLARTASMDYCLFLDADSKIPSRKFIKNYVEHLESNTVLNGGRKYKKTPPTAKNKYLHWLYGTKKESQPAKKRNKVPARYFHTNNFICSRETILKLPFDEQLTGYGYEDILFGHLLIERGIKVVHIDNPVLHNNLETLESFIDKQDQALKNLKLITTKHPTLPIKIWEAYKKLEYYGIAQMTLKLVGDSNTLKDKLIEKPSLRRLKHYRLAKCIELYNEVAHL